jgi:site-specific recombinase XerD
VLEGQRDHALLSILYNTDARIQEALDVCPQAARFDYPACVRLYGKGRRERLCALWPETVFAAQRAAPTAAQGVR